MVIGDLKSIIGYNFSESGVDGDSAEDVVVVELFGDAEMGEPVDQGSAFCHIKFYY